MACRWPRTCYMPDRWQDLVDCTKQSCLLRSNTAHGGRMDDPRIWGNLQLGCHFLGCTYSNENPSRGLISNIFTQLCGIIPTLIVVRVGLGLTSDQTLCTVHPQALRFQHTTSLDFGATSVSEDLQALVQRGGVSL